MYNDTLRISLGQNSDEGPDSGIHKLADKLSFGKYFFCDLFLARTVINLNTYYDVQFSCSFQDYATHAFFVKTRKYMTPFARTNGRNFLA